MGESTRCIIVSLAFLLESEAYIVLIVQTVKVLKSEGTACTQQK